VLASIDFSFYQRWFDAIFLVSALGSIVFIALVNQQQNSDLLSDDGNGESTKWGNID